TVGNNVYVTFRDHTLPYSPSGSIFFMESNNAGSSWNPPLSTSSVPMDVSSRIGITGWSNGIAVSGSTVALAYMSGCTNGQNEPFPNGGNGDCGVYASYSNNGGQSFYIGSPVNNDVTSGPITDVSSSTFAASGSYVFVVWQDQVTSNFQVYFSKTSGQVVQPPPSATISTQLVSGPVGSSVAVTGNNFIPGSTVTVRFDGATVATIATNSSGGFLTSIIVPAAVAGSHTIAASDGTSTLSKSFDVIAKIFLSPIKGQSGTLVTVTGTGFAAGSQVTITFGGSNVATTTSDSTGGFSAPFTVPPDPSGSYSVVATDSKGNASSASFNLGNTVIKLTPVRGAVEKSVSVTGTGFATSSPITLTYDGNTVASSISNSSGGFATSFTVPPSPAGKNTITATDGTNSASATYTVVPKIALTPIRAAPGSTVTVTGTGFAAASNVSITFFGNSTPTINLTTVTTDSAGRFSTTFTVPSDPVASGYTVRATDLSGNSATAPFTIR
ncbi:MAG: IPT/TIG domain-containing protein, partial [Rhabdochlamydiaceae bacterium]